MQDPTQRSKLQKAARKLLAVLENEVPRALDLTQFKFGQAVEVRQVMKKLPLPQYQLEPFFYKLQEPPVRMFDIITAARPATMQPVPLKSFQLPGFRRLAMVPGEERLPHMYSREEIDARLQRASKPLKTTGTRFTKRLRGSIGSLEPTAIGHKYTRALLQPPSEVPTQLSEAAKQLNRVVADMDAARYDLELRLGRKFSPDEIIRYPERVMDYTIRGYGVLRPPSDEVRRAVQRLGLGRLELV